MREMENVDNQQLNLSNSVLYILQSQVSDKRIKDYLADLQQQGVLRVKGLKVFV